MLFSRLNRKTSAASHMASGRFPLTVGFAVLLPVRNRFQSSRFSCSFCVTSTRITTTHHIILAASDGSEHSEAGIRLVFLEKDALTYPASVAHLGASVFVIHAILGGTDGPK